MEPINWLQYVAMAVSAVLVPLAVELLKQVWPRVPSWAKALLSLVSGSLFAMLGSYLSGLLGYPVDLSLLEQFFAGATLGLGATVGFKVGKAS